MTNGQVLCDKQPEAKTQNGLEKDGIGKGQQTDSERIAKGKQKH